MRTLAAWIRGARRPRETPWEAPAAEPVWTGLPPGLLRNSRLLLVVWLGLLTIVLGVLLAVFAGAVWAAFALLPFALLVWGWGMLGRNWRSWRYAERADDLLISRGVLLREETVAHVVRADAAGRGDLQARGAALRAGERAAAHGGRRDGRVHPGPGPDRGRAAARPADRAGRGPIGGAVNTPAPDTEDIWCGERKPLVERRLHPVTPFRRAWAPVAVVAGWAVHDPNQAQEQLTRLTTTALLIGLAAIVRRPPSTAF